MILALPIVTAFGVVSTAWVSSSSETLSVPLVLEEPPVVLVVLAIPPPAAVAVVVRRGGLGRARSRRGDGGTLSASRTRLPRLSQRLHNNRQHISRRDVIESASDRVGELDVGIKLGDQSPDKRHVHRPGDDVDPIGAHVG